MPLDQPPEPQTPIEQRAEELRMTFGEHLEELRSNLIRSIIGIVIILLITCYYGTSIIGWILLPLIQAQVALGHSPEIITTDPTAGFMSVYIKVTLISALILASPWIVWQLWQFVSKGLYDHEKKIAHILAPFSLTMTTLGVLFTYYILLPTCLVFFIGFTASYPQINPDSRNFMIDLLVPSTALTSNQQLDASALGSEGANTENNTTTENLATTEPLKQFPVLQEDPTDAPTGSIWINAPQRRLKIALGNEIQSIAFTTSRVITPLPDAGQFISFATMMGLGVVAGFQLPVIMLVIGWTQLIDWRMVAKMRKYAFFACFVAGAVLTPTDIFSMLLLGMPLYLLFEFGLFLMKITERQPADD
ncbi:twin-arginine translocase subunit TatC [Poriferisphaera sp. WC338]|uniref:twin-arginine translocase subunit TatC n=1 Tax=Poriferisphaera sp. WC338 TaxID=3425129 RepID=UPI003D815E21